MQTDNICCNFRVTSIEKMDDIGTFGENTVRINYLSGYAWNKRLGIISSR